MSMQHEFSILFKARLCKSCSTNGNYNDIQMGLMNVEMKKSKMTFGEASVRVGSMPREDVLREMERISLINELEERYLHLMLIIMTLYK